jgi:hypothetical protein
LYSIWFASDRFLPSNELSGKIKLAMNKSILTRIGWSLIGLSALLILITWLTSPVIKSQSLQVSLDHVIGQLSTNEQAQIRAAGLDGLIRNCSMDLKITSPQTLRIGKTSGINLNAIFVCPGSISLPRGSAIKVNLQNDARLVIPMGEITKVLDPGKQTEIAWAIQSKNAKPWHGTVWVMIVFSENLNPSIQILLAAVPLATQFNTFLGLSESQLLWTVSGIAILGLLFLISGYINRKRTKFFVESTSIK